MANVMVLSGVTGRSADGQATGRRSRSEREPVASSCGAGVAGLLRVELGGGQRAVLDRGDERARRGRPGHQRGQTRVAAAARRAGKARAA